MVTFVLLVLGVLVDVPIRVPMLRVTPEPGEAFLSVRLTPAPEERLTVLLLEFAETPAERVDSLKITGRLFVRMIREEPLLVADSVPIAPPIALLRLELLT